MKSGYTPRVTIFGSRNNTLNTIYTRDASTVSRLISQAGYKINNGGSNTGLMGVVAQSAKEAGGSVFGVALSKFEPTPHEFLDDYEGYADHCDRQRRLIELGDAFIALPGAIGTFHEILEVHILNILGEINKPIVLVGEYFQRYKMLIDSFTKEGIMHPDTTPLFYAKDGKEAASIIIEYFEGIVSTNQPPETYYPALSSEKIYDHISRVRAPYYILFEKIVMKVFPGVYPSNRFRSSELLAKLVRATSKGKRIADMACGHGTMGLVALDAGAEEVVMSDINPTAIQNAKYNLEKSPHKNRGVVFESNLFEKLPSLYKQSFDIIFFNPPFHNERVEKVDTGLAYAFRTQRNQESVLVKFLDSAKDYLTKDGCIYIGFSNKDRDALALLEETLSQKDYLFNIVQQVNIDTAADNRIYKVTVK